MTIDKAVIKFEKLVNEVANIIPTVLKDGSVCFHNYIIRKNKLGLWELAQIGNKYRTSIGQFYMKSSALIAAQHHKHNRIMELAKTKDLDQRYWSNFTDSEHFRIMYKRASDELKRDVFLWRWEQTRDRSELYKEQITASYNNAFR